MMRYLIGKPDFLPSKIGNHSFMAGSTNGFGIIEKLSPVFLVSKDSAGNDAYLLEAGIDHQKNKETGKVERFGIKKEEKTDDAAKYGVYSTGYKGVEKIPNLDFDYKEFLISALYNNNCPNELTDPSELFVEQFQVGNKKNYIGGTDDEAFFKQVFYRLKKNCAFGVFLETNEALPSTCIDTLDADNTYLCPTCHEIHTSFKCIETMGADQSIYKIEALPLEETENIFETIVANNESVTGVDRIVLLSDAYVEAEVVEKCSFSICDTNDFRNIVTHSADNQENKKTKSFYGMNSAGSAQKTKVKFNLLRRGSVIFSENPQDLLKQLNKDKDDFHKIGYNYFQITN